MPFASPFSILSSMALKIGRPGILADRFSINSSIIFSSSCLAKARNSIICASMLKICLSSTSVDLRAYKKNFCINFMLIFLKLK
ncbi:MAG: hypothetical protein A2445_03790 [Candidatus Jacksonbacteria bacterium RIFOXYC2_FULL_44_29]|nr:MAG: hypothetical protein A2240_02490 [Candidatus Jacksonbacteria bacterium RIFOXYA2_FULL_43_12]OGY77270.1 MAG: hypothetical protein A2445_03790 [Candidatus Jacksonbacteria bacterium RIFOXYC2_FULL_44_29]OGY77816.1 MAG: hypothetical protein A2295_04425 [Candidatus Jacksonbacteria bacterium RIFOXYB2_FULL_44_15]OGY78300.1 MAG: hypothetical protein A2550_03785 [Candidatus Jacksonbacteria bacterium RIFOXYD2_FULL_43_21]